MGVLDDDEYRQVMAVRGTGTQGSIQRRPSARSPSVGRCNEAPKSLGHLHQRHLCWVKGDGNRTDSGGVRSTATRIHHQTVAFDAQLSASFDRSRDRLLRRCLLRRLCWCLLCRRLLGSGLLCGGYLPCPLPLRFCPPLFQPLPAFFPSPLTARFFCSLRV